MSTDYNFCVFDNEIIVSVVNKNIIRLTEVNNKNFSKIKNIIKDYCSCDIPLPENFETMINPNIEIETYSPPYKPEFSQEDNQAIIDAINRAKPDLLWIGMTAPKQEKWTYAHWKKLNVHCHVGNIGAVFDFYAGTVKRAPLWWQRHGLEWAYRLLKEPRRMWKRYVVGNMLFLYNVYKESRS